jgi:predicted nucleotidyltransferase
VADDRDWRADLLPDLAALIARLSDQDAVDGIVVMGSAATGKLAATSDYDLLVILASCQAPLLLVVTEIGGRFSELYFASTSLIDAVIASENLASLVRDERALFGGTMLDWIRTAAIVFDRHGRLSRARDRLAGEGWYSDVTAEERYLAWFQINYNLAHTSRMAASPDSVYALAVDLRLLYTISDLWRLWFRLRNIPSRGEKGDIRYLETHAPAVLEQFRGLLSEVDRSHKLALYRELAALVLEPVGELWPEATTAIQLQPGADTSPAAIAHAQVVWQSLAGESE